MNPGEWKNDPRLAAMDPFKLQYIEKIAAQISSQSKAELFPALLSLQADARKSNHITFTDQETTLSRSPSSPPACRPMKRRGWKCCVSRKSWLPRSS